MAAQHKRRGAKAKRERQERAEVRTDDPRVAKQSEYEGLRERLAQTQGRINGLVGQDDEDSLFPEKVRSLRRRLEAHADLLEARMLHLKLRWGLE